MRTKWVAVSVICLLSARPSAAGEPPHAVTALFERAARPAALKGIGEASIAALGGVVGYLVGLGW